MCGGVIHMLKELLPVIRTRAPKTTTLYPANKIFMYAKKNCWFSKRAHTHLKELGFINITIVDKNKGQFLCSDKWVYIDADGEKAEQLNTLMDVWNDSEYDTVPQIFTHLHPQWYYVGDCETVTKFGTSDMLHLIDWQRSPPAIPAFQLKL